MRYRSDIDGLRAIAVLLVVLFHARLPGITGGFTGVDVFFVISGYLITGIIFGEIQTNSFSIVRFYERRARRILPILSFTLLSVAALGWLLNTPVEYRNLGRSLIASAFFSNNLALNRTPGGYFAPSADSDPLLHLWSLGIEEQFYLFFPILLSLVARRMPRALLPVLGLVGVLSFVASEISLSSSAQSVFYLLHFRAWELLVGALLAIALKSKAVPAIVANFLSVVGLGMILYAALFLGAQTPFPGAYALLPVLGTALLLATGSGGGGGGVVNRLLSFPLLVFIGQLSFSWYLWHWPLLVYGQFLSRYPLKVSERFTIVGVSLLVSYFTWKFIETPLRRGSLLAGTKILFSSAAGALVLVAVVGYSIYSPTNPVARLHARAFFQDPANRTVAHEGDYRTSVAPVKTIVWGDSHAAHLMGLSDIHHPSVQFISVPGAPPAVGVSVAFDSNDAPSTNSGWFRDQIAADDTVEQVVLAARWDFYFFGKDTSGFETKRSRICMEGKCIQDLREQQHVLARALERTVASLREANKNVVILGPLPSLSFVPPRVMRLWKLFDLSHGNWMPSSEQKASVEWVETVLKEISTKHHVRYISLFSEFCPNGCWYEKDGIPLFTDSNHLSYLGAQRVWNLVFPPKPLEP